MCSAELVAVHGNMCLLDVFQVRHLRSRGQAFFWAACMSLRLPWRVKFEMGVPSSAAISCCTRSTNAPLPSPWIHKFICSIAQTLYHFIVQGNTLPMRWSPQADRL